ncbi:hypothetical protein JTB14_001505 [Gonioctena quinquepunctata]|nr:hypothetical protein JTB14_001505 [Gonioctena quinquepunctata]
MRLTHVLRLVNNQTLDALKNVLKTTIAEAPQYLNTVKEEQKKIVYNKIANLNKWYVKVIGLDEVKLYQDRVTSLQEQLLKTQEKRREVSSQLNVVRQRSVDIQNQIQHIDRKEKFDVYYLSLEQSVTNTFQEYDQTERELFTAFANAIRDSHEKQRAQLEYTKYLGLVLSIAGSFLAFVYTTYKKHDLKLFIDEKLSTLVEAKSDPLAQGIIDANKTKIEEIVIVNHKMIEEIMRNRETLNGVVQLLKMEGKMGDTSHLVTPSHLEINGDFGDHLLTMIKISGGLLVACIILRAITG